MCIEINRAKKAKEDIPVWKVMKVVKFYYKVEEEYLTPFQDYPKKGLQTPAKYFGKVQTINTIFNKGVKFKGGYHCFATQELAQKYLSEIICMPWNIYTICQYYIPKGELYAEGKVLPGFIGYGISSIRARTLRKTEEK